MPTTMEDSFGAVMGRGLNDNGWKLYRKCSPRVSTYIVDHIHSLLPRVVSQDLQCSVTLFSKCVEIPLITYMIRIIVLYRLYMYDINCLWHVWVYDDTHTHIITSPCHSVSRKNQQHSADISGAGSLRADHLPWWFVQRPREILQDVMLSWSIDFSIWNLVENDYGYIWCTIFPG